MEEPKTRGRKPKQTNNVPLEADEFEESSELVLDQLGATEEQANVIHEQTIARATETYSKQPKTTTPNTNKEELFNCLRNEIINVKYIPREGAFKVDPRSPIANGKADTANDRVVVPLRKDGSRLLDPLDNKEKAFLENYLGMEPNALSIYKKPCYWSSATKGAINYVELTKDGIRLDLKDPYDYLRYAILRSNKEFICQSQEDLVQNPKATYRYVMISNSAEESAISNKAKMRSECNKMLAQYEGNHDQLLTILKLIEGKRMAPKTSKDVLLDKIQSYIFENPRLAKKALEDDYIEEKTIIDNAIIKGVITKGNGIYRFHETKQVLAEEGDTSTYQNAAVFLSKPANKDIKFRIQELIKES